MYYSPVGIQLEPDTRDVNEFLIDDSGELGHAAYSSFYTGTSGDHTTHVYAVHAPAGKKYCTVLRFMHSMRDHIKTLMDTWVPLPIGPVPPCHLYLG